MIDELNELVARHLLNWPHGEETLGQHNKTSMLMHVNILFGMVTTDRNEKLELIGRLFGRTFTTTKELQIAEARALLALASYYYDHEKKTTEVDEDVLEWLKEVNNAQPV